MDLHQYLQALRKFWWVIVAAMVVGALYGAWSASQSVTRYRASVTFFVVTTSTDSSASAAVQGDQFAQRRVNSYVALLSTDRLAERVAAAPDLDLAAGEVQEMIGASGDLDTVLLTATVTSPSEDLTQQVAELVAVEFVELVGEIEGGGDGPASVNLEVVSGPSVRQVPARAALAVAVPMAMGALLGLGLALLLELRDNTLRTEDQLVALGAGPVLGRIPFDHRVRLAPLIIDVDSTSMLAESFRQLRTNLQFIDLERSIQVLVVTSSVADEGKSVTSANLALSLVGAGRRTLVVEADLRRPKVAEYFEIDRSLGLTDVLAGQAELDDVLHRWGNNGPVILPSGSLPPNPSELLGSDAMRELLDRLRQQFDIVIVDTPPLVPVTDGAVAAARADGVVLVTRHGKTTRQQVRLALGALSAAGVPMLGTAMTMVPTGRGATYAGYERRSPSGPPGPPQARPEPPLPAGAPSPTRRPGTGRPPSRP